VTQACNANGMVMALPGVRLFHHWKNERESKMSFV
jgi:hypothetical protein